MPSCRRTAPTADSSVEAHCKRNSHSDSILAKYWYKPVATYDYIHTSATLCKSKHPVALLWL